MAWTAYRVSIRSRIARSAKKCTDGYTSSAGSRNAMYSARILDATVARRYQVMRRGATSAAAAQARAPRTTADTGTGQLRVAPGPAMAAIGTSHSAAAVK